MPLEREFIRSEILERLRGAVRAGRPILAAGCSVGLVAKCAEVGGADLLVVYSTGRSRIMGLPTTPLGDSNATTLAMYDEIANVVNDTPIIGGAEATDPTYLSLPRLIARFRQTGYAGLINFPTIGNNPTRSAMREDVGLGFSREVELVRLARRQDYFTMAYVFDVEQARRMAAAGVDAQVAHVGWTAGGLAGATASALTPAAAAERVQAMIEATRREQPECLCLAHGGPFATPEDTRSLYAHTDAVGFVGASSIERIPIERAVTETVAAFKAIRLRRGDEEGGGADAEQPDAGPVT
jgi:predicted TIM-barrel enzyme